MPQLVASQVFGGLRQQRKLRNLDQARTCSFLTHIFRNMLGDLCLVADHIFTLQFSYLLGSGLLHPEPRSYPLALRPFRYSSRYHGQSKFCISSIRFLSSADIDLPFSCVPSRSCLYPIRFSSWCSSWRFFLSIYYLSCLSFCRTTIISALIPVVKGRACCQSKGGRG